MQELRVVFVRVCVVFLLAAEWGSSQTIDKTNVPANPAPQAGVAAGLAPISAREIALAQAGLDRVKALVEAGALPKARLIEAEEKLADAKDEAIYERTLYATPSAALSEADVKQMVAAAERRLERARAALLREQELSANGAIARNEAAPAAEEVRERETALTLARQRAELFEELAAAARREQMAEAAPTAAPPVDHYNGGGRFDPSILPSIEQAFQLHFSETLPVSAYGQTAVHEALGFDHRGRVDVAVNPDTPEGQWLRSYLASRHIPFYAFRAAVPGKATGAHIHIGTGSPRLHAALHQIPSRASD
jgi:hypothetical protein